MSKRVNYREFFLSLYTHGNKVDVSKLFFTTPKEPKEKEPKEEESEEEEGGGSRRRCRVEGLRRRKNEKEVLFIMQQMALSFLMIQQGDETW